MRTALKLITLASILYFALNSCQKDSPSGPSPSALSNLNTTLKGKWKITYFIQDGNDKTAPFDGYSVEFGEANITARKESEVIYGTWKTKFEINELKLIFKFDSAPAFSNLNQDWNVSQINASIARLTYVDNNDDDKNDFIVFEKL